MTSTYQKTYSLTTAFISTTNDLAFSVTNVYTSSDHRLTPDFVAEMVSLHASVRSPWLVVGDYNLIRYPNEKNNNNFDTNLAASFKGLIRDVGWFELPLSDRLYTWSNQQENPVLVRLNHAFFNTAWNDAFPNSVLSSLPRPVSDHHPLIVSAASAIPNTSHFRFKNLWLLDPSFLPSSLQCWSLRVPLADAALGIAASIKRFRSAAKAWKWEHWYVPEFDNNYRFVIDLLDFVEESRMLAAEEFKLRRCARDHLAASVCRAAAHWKQ
jgi:hypothetical protein